MKPNREQLAALSAVLSADLEAIQRLDAQLTSLAPSLELDAPEFRDLAAIAFVLHGLYNAMENTFQQVSRTFENHVTHPTQWHKELLAKMFLEIPSVRPAVLPAKLRMFLDDLRGFRHLFRHAYDFEPDGLKLRPLVGGWQRSHSTLIGALAAFRDYLLAQANRLPEN